MWGDMSLWNVQGPPLHSRDHIDPRILTNDYTFNQCLSFQHFMGDHAPRPLLFIEESVFVQVLVFKIPPPPVKRTLFIEILWKLFSILLLFQFLSVEMSLMTFNIFRFVS